MVGLVDEQDVEPGALGDLQVVYGVLGHDGDGLAPFPSGLPDDARGVLGLSGDLSVPTG